MLNLTAVAGLIALGAGTAPAPAPGAVAGARIAAVEAERCVSTCPLIPKDATSDWLRSPDGQRANGCKLACRTGQPASTLYRELLDLAARKKLQAETPLVILAGKDGPELVRRLQGAMREADGRSLGPLCARARESLGPRDEGAFLDCVGRRAPGQGAFLPPPETARALACAVAFTERDADWLRRCPGLEAKLDVDACVKGFEESGERRPRPRSRSACEREAIEHLAGAFGGGDRP